MRVVFWALWVITMVISLIYVGVGLSTFSKIANVKVDSNTKKLKYGMMGSCLLGFIMVIKFLVLSAGISMRGNSPYISMRAEMGYGAMVGAAIDMVFFMLLAGLALHSGAPWAKATFPGGMSYGTFQAAYAFAYVLAFMFLVLFFVIACSHRHGHGNGFISSGGMIHSGGMMPGGGNMINSGGMMPGGGGMLNSGGVMPGGGGMMSAAGIMPAALPVAVPTAMPAMAETRVLQPLGMAAAYPPMAYTGRY